MRCPFCNPGFNELGIPGSRRVALIAPLRSRRRRHVLVAPREHLSGNDLRAAREIMPDVADAAEDLRAHWGCTGLRVSVNSGRSTGQRIEHLHFHVEGFG